MANLLRIFIISYLIFGCIACRFEKGVDLPPAVVCDSVSNVSFSAQVLPILKKNCWGCHDAATHTFEVTLETYEQVREKAADMSLGSSKLSGVINRKNGFRQMPFNGTKLKQCEEINLIDTWIKEGMKNN